MGIAERFYIIERRIFDMGSKTKMPKTGNVYLYAVSPCIEEKELGLKGLFDFDVYTISEGGICAVVSEIPAKVKLRPERKHIAAHQAVTNSLLQNNILLLPVSFGTIVENVEEIREMLKKYHKAFQEQIEKVSGKVQMELRVVYEVPNVFEYFVNKYPDLKLERDEVFSSGGEADREQKIELGQHFEQVQSQDRELLTEQVEKKLIPPCVEVKRNNPRDEKDVMRISCLVEKEKLEEFEDAVNEALGTFDDNFAFDYVGPLPPYSFAEVRVHM